jgi:hypothetical protein
MSITIEVPAPEPSATDVLHEIVEESFANDSSLMPSLGPARAPRLQGLSALMADPSIALWAEESAAHYRVTPLVMLGVLAEALEGQRC